MAATLIRGNTQLRGETITNAQIATDANIEVSKLQATSAFQMSPDGGTTKYPIKNS